MCYVSFFLVVAIITVAMSIVAIVKIIPVSSPKFLFPALTLSGDGRSVFCGLIIEGDVLGDISVSKVVELHSQLSKHQNPLLLHSMTSALLAQTLTTMLLT